MARDQLELMPSFEAYTQALERLGELELGDTSIEHEVRAVDPFSPQARAETAARTHQNHGCGAANLVASVSATGVSCTSSVSIRAKSHAVRVVTSSAPKLLCSHPARPT